MDAPFDVLFEARLHDSRIFEVGAACCTLQMIARELDTAMARMAGCPLLSACVSDRVSENHGNSTAGRRFVLPRSWASIALHFRMERGKKNVCLPTMEVLAQGFEIPLAQLVRGLEREEPAKRNR